MGNTSLTEELKGLARDLGFARAGVARAGRLDLEGERLRAWLARGRHGDMQWMRETAEVRIDPTDARMLEGARSILVLAAPYAPARARVVGPAPGRVARYAWGRDYHNVLGKRARKLARRLRRDGHEARVSVDSVPVFERAWAQRAGIGFIGKNCCLIVPGLGSHLFLACVITDAELVPDEPMKERCGSCRLCLDVCPTDAFVAARQIDARRCISYLTIEHRGEVDVSLRPGVGDWIFGCDACQDVCPYNRTSTTHDEAFEPDARFDRTRAEDLLGMDEESFRVWASGSPLKRARREGMARNAAMVLGNAGDRRHLPVLASAAEADPSESVRRTAAWAAERIVERLGQSSEGSGKPT